MGNAATPRLVLGVLAGLGGGLVLGSFVLLYLGLQAQSLPCPFVSLTECAFHHQTQTQLTRFFLLTALGTLVTGSGVLLWLRADARKSP